MRILVEFCIDADIIECPDFIVEDLKIYQVQFTKWLYNLNNDHAYWIYEDSKKNGCSYRAKAFVEWLNQFVLNDYEEKAKVLEECVEQDGFILKEESEKAYIIDKQIDCREMQAMPKISF